MGLARGWPTTEMPYSTSVPMTRRTDMRPAYGYLRRPWAGGASGSSPGVNDGEGVTDDRSDRAIGAAELLGLAFEVTRHGPVHSLEAAAAARGVQPHQLVKTMVVRVSE